MVSDLDTVRVLRALFNDMPKAPQGLSHEETMAWVQRSMADFEGGDMAYMIEHITRSSMLDIVLRLREDAVSEPNQREANQKSAPAVERGLFLVPKVIE